MCFGAPPCESKCNLTRLQRAMLGKYLARRARWNWQKHRIYAILSFNLFLVGTTMMTMPLFYLPVVDHASVIQNLLEDTAEGIHVALVGYHMGLKVFIIEFGGVHIEMHKLVTLIVH